MKYLSSFVQKPTAPPQVSNNLPGTYEVAHLRKNLSGGNSEAVILTNVHLPNDVYPQTYYSDELAEDVILVRGGSTGNWKKVVKSGPTFSIPASIPSGWETVIPAQLADNQLNFAVTDLDFGLFGSASEPARALFMVNDGTETGTSLSLGVRTLTGGSIAVLDDRLSLRVVGVFSKVGLGAPDDGYNGSVVFSQSGTNSLPILLPPSFAAKISLSLINFPAYGLESTPVEAEVLLTLNRNSTAVPANSNWEDGAILVSPLFPTQLVEEGSFPDTVTVNPYSVRVGDRVFSSTSAIQVPINGAGNWELYVTSAGNLTLTGQGRSDLVSLARFSWVDGAITNYKLTAPVQESRRYIEPANPLTIGKFVSVNSAGQLAHSSNGLVGVATSEDGYYVSQGYARVKLAGAVVKGNLLGPNSNQEGVISTEGIATALQSGTVGDLILCYLQSVSSGGSGGGGSSPSLPSDLSITFQPFQAAVANSNGTGFVIPAATTSQIGLMTSTDKVKLNGVESRANHTGTQPSSTISNFTTEVTGLAQGAFSAGSGITITPNNGVRVISAVAGSPTNLGLNQGPNSIGITNSNGTGVAIGGATAGVNGLAGFMTNADKIKLDGLSTQSLTLSSANGALSLGLSGSNSVSFSAATTSQPGLLSAADKVKLDGLSGGGGGATNLGAAYGTAILSLTSSSGTGVNVNAATSSTAGVMSSSDKSKLDALLVSPQLSTSGLAGSVSLALSGSNTISLPVASGSVAGVLTSSNFSSFSSKQGALTNAGTGQGILNGGGLKSLKVSGGGLTIGSTSDEITITAPAQPATYTNSYCQASYPGTLLEIGASVWVNYNIAPTITTNVGGYSVSGGGIALPGAGLYQITWAGLTRSANSTTVRALASVNAGAWSLHTVINGTPAVRDVHFSYSAQIYVGGVTITPSVYMDLLTAGPIYFTVYSINITRLV